MNKIAKNEKCKRIFKIFNWQHWWRGVTTSRSGMTSLRELRTHQMQYELRNLIKLIKTSVNWPKIGPEVRKQIKEG